MVLSVVQGKKIISKNLFVCSYVLLIIEKSTIIWVLLYLYTPFFFIILKLRLISRNPYIFFFIFPIIDITGR